MTDTPRRSRFASKVAIPLAGIVLLAATAYLMRHFPLAAPEGAAPAAATATPREIYYGPRRSLAVLPFEDRSANGDQAALAHGFAAELLDRFVDLPALQVTARSSSFFFRDGTTPLRVVAERLQAAYLLGGSWQDTGDTLAVTAILYDAYRDRELWHGDFEGEPGRLLQLRDRIVGDVLDELPGTPIQPLEPSAEPHPEAWELLQRGRFEADPLGSGDLAAADAAFRAALESQPGYDAAQLERAALWLHPAWPRAADPDAVERARHAVLAVLDRPASAASATTVDRARAWGLLSHVRHQYDWHWVAAAEAAQQAVDLRPGDAGLLALASLAQFTLGDTDSAQALLQASLDRDPLNLGSRLRLGLLQEFSGQFDEALASYRQVLSLRSGYPAAHAFRARIKVLQGKAESALTESAGEADPFWRRYAEVLALVAAGRRDESQPLLQQMIDDDGAVAAFQIAELLAFGGEVDEAFAWLERARAERDPGVSALLGNPLLASLHADIRWAALLEALQLPPD